MSTDLFRAAIERLEAENEKLRAENMQLKIAAANSLSYFRSHKAVKSPVSKPSRIIPILVLNSFST